MTHMSQPLDELCYLPGGLRAAGVTQRLALLVYRAGLEVLAHGEARLEEIGIDGREYTALAILATDHPESQQELARLMGKPPPIVVAVVDELERKGLAERRRSERDRRRSVVELTKAGRAMLERGDRVADEVMAELFGSISAEERETLHLTLRRALAPQPAELQASP
jgi:DNA-binding MarR family transcriptional regulator